MGTKLEGPDSAIRIQIATQPKLAHEGRQHLARRLDSRGSRRIPAGRCPTPRRSPGSILPAKRIVAFYGNPLSKQMGILGEIPYDQMLAKLDTVVG